MQALVRVWSRLSKSRRLGSLRLYFDDFGYLWIAHDSYVAYRATQAISTTFHSSSRTLICKVMDACIWGRNVHFWTNRKTQAKSQQIVVQRLLSCLQHLVLYLSRLQRIYLSQYLKLCFSILSACHTWGPTECVAILWCWIHRSVPIVILCTSGKVIIVYSSMDSDLEAFSHNPTDGSFAALAFQLTAFTNYLNRRFLSYLIGLLFRQRTHQ